MAGTKTGNKGFINPVDGKVYVMDPVPPGDPGANASPPAYDPGELTVDNRVKDISAKTRITLGTYLSKVTKGTAGSATKPNAYTVDESSSASLPQPITTDGLPTPIGPSDNAEQFQPVLPSSFSQDFSAVQAPAATIKKGRAPGPGADGHELLPGATATPISTQLVVDGPVDKYTKLALEPNHWIPGTAGFTGGEDPLNPSRDFNVPLQSVATAVRPSEEATVPPNAAYQLDLQLAARQAEALTEVNAFPVVVGNVSLASTTTPDGQHPAPLTPIVADAFAPYLRNAYDEDVYGKLSVGSAGGLQKGRSPEDGPTGHSFLSRAEVTGGELTGPAPLPEYVGAAIEQNRWSSDGASFAGGEDPLNPPRDFNVPLQSEATPVLPGDEATAPQNAKYELTLEEAAAKPAQMTGESTNYYKLSAPDVDNLASTTDALGYPAPLTPVSNANAEFHAGEILPGASAPYAAVAASISKGKSLDSSRVLNGNTLLGSSIADTALGAMLPDPLKVYTKLVTDENFYTPEDRLVDPSVDPSAPPANFDPALRRVEEKGKNLDAPSTIVKLESLRKIPGSATADNSYPVDSTLYTLDSTTDESGDPLRIVDSKNDARFVRNRSDIKPLSGDPSLTNFSKGQGDREYDGHNLLKTVSGNSDVKSNNRNFKTPVRDSTPEGHPVYAYRGDRGAGALEIGRNRFLSAQAPASGFDPTLTLADGTRVSTLKLAKVGTGLGLRATAEIPAWTSSDFDPTGEISELGAVLPSVAQLGILKVNNQLLSAKDVLDSIESADDVPAGALAEIAPFGGQSWGSMSNASEQFDDPGSSIGMFLTLLAIMIALTLLYSLISLLTSPGERVKTNAKGQYILGSYKFKEPSNSLFTFPDVSEIFGIKPTVNSYEDALLAGFSSFFLGATNLNTSALGIILSLAASSVNALADATFADNSVLGANLVVCRSIVRSGLVFAEYISGLVRKFQLSIVGGVKAALGILKVFRSSKFIASLNVFSALGDQLLNAKLAAPTVLGADGKPQSVGLLDSISADRVRHSTVRKNRLTSNLGYDPTLSWASKRAPSLYLIPQNVQTLVLADSQNTLGSFKGASALRQDKEKIKERNYYSTSKNRISKEDREKIERLLDSEYVPFYFHDVRTNEIISFHAFLASLGDSYTASYDSVEGFGRVEPIKVYKNTTRKIEMSFYVASTSIEDFDYMWHKINKLTTLVYPQYTKGKLTVSEEGASYRSPFSQLVGASPLIRIRLGDLFRSNYSRFALARLFGAADGDTKLPDKDGTIKGIDIKNNEEETADAKKRMENLQAGDIVWIKGQEYLGKFLIKSPTGNGYIITEEGLPEADGTLQISRIDAAAEPKSLGQLALTQDTIAKIMSEISDGTDSPLNDFMSPEQNSIVKSFESSGGKGLAGFIESMSFDWYDRVTWEIEPYQTAPKMCKVTISFAPIHDISPGIDHMGYNRAPIYPVGYAMATGEPAAE